MKMNTLTRHPRIFVLYSVLSTLAVLLALAVGCCLYSKSEISTSWEDATLYYRGFGFSENNNIWGKMYYKIVVSEYDCGYWVTTFRSAGFNHYKGFYANGKLKEEGEISVGLWGYYDKPLPDRHMVRNGKYYRPDGTLGSTVSQGTGTQMLWYPNGQLRWELELVNGERVQLKTFKEDGRLRQHIKYVDGKEVRLNSPSN